MHQSYELAQQCACNLAESDGSAHIIKTYGLGYLAVTNKFDLDRTYYHNKEGKKQFFEFVETITKIKS